MEDSILVSTKHILGLSEDYTPFDLDVITHINAAFSTLSQMGVGPTDAIVIIDDSALWTEIDISPNQLSMLRSYIFLKVRLAFDPPTTSFAIESFKQQSQELEWRMNVSREGEVYG